MPNPEDGVDMSQYDKSSIRGNRAGSHDDWVSEEIGKINRPDPAIETEISRIVAGFKELKERFDKNGHRDWDQNNRLHNAVGQLVIRASEEESRLRSQANREHWYLRAESDAVRDERIKEIAQAKVNAAAVAAFDRQVDNYTNGHITVDDLRIPADFLQSYH